MVKERVPFECLSTEGIPTVGLPKLFPFSHDLSHDLSHDRRSKENQQRVLCTMYGIAFHC